MLTYNKYDTKKEIASNLLLELTEIDNAIKEVNTKLIQTRSKLFRILQYLADVEK